MTSSSPSEPEHGCDSHVTVPSRLLSELFSLALQSASLREQVMGLQDRLDREVPYLRDEIKHERDLRTLTGSGPAMRAVRQAIQQVAATDSTVLINGETGTGKELVARAIHQLSPRRDHLLVTVNCAALSPQLLTSELFGHEQGAFTGAGKRRVGRFELAQRGTILLDEIAEVPLETQVLLLRVLQERVIERVGGNEPIPIDVRVIAATHQDLSQAVADGLFRADLFFRLNVFPIRVPPLRERHDDIPDLIRHFLHLFNRRMNRQIETVDASTVTLLQDYHWPGNVRELENLVERAMIVTAGAALRMDPSWLVYLPSRADEPWPNSLHEVECRAIVAALDKCRGRIYGPKGAAAALGLKPTTLYGKMRRFGIRKSETNAR
jgi:formate hydrogenlyase transcriptional activator